ncbi:MAG: DinB family protein [Anaerolineaceae bacterium]|nr:DinB family protein [Anaerolineaceae bacterium]
MKQQIDFLFAYNGWASALLWQAINQLNDEQWSAGQSYSVGSVCDHIIHVIYASKRWLTMMQGRKVRDPLVPSDFPHIKDAEARWIRDWTMINQYVAGLNDAGLEEEIEWGPTSRGYQGSTPRWQILNHMANHAMDHRSQILMVLNTQFGIKTPEQDMIFYIDALSKAEN